ncbi:MAG: autotransporter-associated beta strand repeat-containing protein, partial [Pirellulales bacterium]|nr:autotransporter-associated beta strand repeat-containing protein [Pirellulales bacterium]
QQKLDCWVSNRLFAASTNGYIGINLNNAIMSGSVEIPNLWLTDGFSLNTPGSSNTSIVKVSGPGDLQIDGNIHLSSHASCDISINTDTLINVAGALSTSNVGVTTTTLRKLGSGTIIFNGASPNTSPNVDFAQNVAIGAADSALTALTDVGSIRLYNAGALGLAGSASGSYTQIRGANYSNGRLELAGNIALGEYLILNGRGGMNSLNPAIVNYSGDNSVDGAMIGTATDAAFFNFGANNTGEKLTVINDFSVTASGDRGVNFVGAGDGEFTGSIMGTGTNASVSLGKYGAGTLTLSGSANDRIGHVLVRQGALILGASSGFTFSSLAHGSIASLPSTIQVDSGTTLDASPLPSGLSVSTVVQGHGNVLGTLVANANGGMKVKPGDLATADPAYPAAIASLDAAVGTLTVGNLDMSTTITGTGGNPEMVWDLAALSTANPGTDFDRLSVGNLTLGGASTLNLNFSLLPAAMRPNAVAPDLFWTSNHSWKIIDAAANAGGTNFAGYLNNLVTAGQFTTSVGAGADAGDIFLDYTVIPYDELTWVGGANGNAWDNNGTANWHKDGVPPLVKFTVLDQVTFNDGGSNSPAVNVAEDLTSGTITFDNSTKDYALTGPGAILGGAALLKNGTGKATIANSGINAFTGAIAVNSGTLQVGAGGTVGNLGPGEITLAASGALTYNRSDDVTLANTLLGAGNLRHEGAGILTLTGANASFAGTVTVASGTLKAGIANALGGASATAAVADGATLDVNALNLGSVQVHAKGAGAGGVGAIVNSSATTQNNALKTIVADGDFAVGGTGRWAVSGGSLASSVGNYKLTKVGANTVAIIGSAVSADLGDIDIQDGTLQFETASTMGNAAKTVTIGPLGALGFYNVTNPQNKVLVSNAGRITTTGNNTFSGPMTLDAGTLVQVNSGTFTATNAITGTGFEKTGAGTFAVTADNDSFTGAVTIAAGAITIGSGGATGSLGSAAIANNAALNFNRNAAYAPANVISGTGGVNFQNRYAVVTLDHDNSYTGDNTLYSGTVILKTDKGLGSDGITTGTTHIRTGTDAVRNGRLALNPNAGVDLTIDENFTTSGSGGYPFDYRGPGIIDNLAGNNTITGNITTQSLGGPSLIAVSGGTLALNGVITNAASRRAIVFGGGGNGIVNGTIADTNVIDVEKAGTGTWTFTNGNTYTGNTTVHGGTLAFSGSGNISGSNAIIVKSAAVLDLTPLSSPDLYFSYGTTSGTQSVIGVGTIKGNVYAQSFTNVLSPSGGGALPVNLPGGTMSITGNLTLGATETLQFKLTNNVAGALNDKIVVGGDLNMNSGWTNVSIIPNGALTAGTYTLLSAASASNTGSFSLPANNTRYGMTLDNATDPKKLLLAVTGANASLTWNGGTAGTWDVKTTSNWLNGGSDDMFYQGDAVTFGTPGDAAPTVATLSTTVYPASIAVNSSQDYTIGGAGKISSGASILKQGTGTLTVSNSGGNDYTGGVTILGGTFKMGTADALGSIYDGSLTINGGTLDINGLALAYRSIAHVQGAGAGGAGAIVNHGASRTEVGECDLAYIELDGNTTFGGSGNWILDGQTYFIFSTPYLHGNGFALAKTGANTVSLRNMGNTNLGSVNINQGALLLLGDTTLGATGTVSITDGASLILNNSTAAHTKPLAIGGTGGTINNAAGNNAVSANATLNSLLTVLAANGTTLTLSGNLSGGGGLTKDQPGTLILSGNDSYLGDTTIAAGTLELGATGQITGSNIVNNAAFRVNGGTHAVGTITGTGSTTVLASTTLTAASIVQNSLSIGASAAMAGVSAVPEPSTWLLLLIGLFGWLGWRHCRKGSMIR